MYRHTWAQIFDLSLEKDCRETMDTDYTVQARDAIGANKSGIFISLPIKLAILMVRNVNACSCAKWQNVTHRYFYFYQNDQSSDEINKQIDIITRKLGVLWTAWVNTIGDRPTSRVRF